MARLRHIMANAPLKFPPPPPKNCKDKCTDLQTLSTISPSSCTEDILDKMPNLLNLGIRGNIAELVDHSRLGGGGRICLFHNIQKLHYLETLKLLHEGTGNGQASISWNFPRADEFPRKLRKLTLSNTCFDWKGICILGSLDNLEVLKLEEYAAKGNSWELKDVVFKSLQFLHINRADLVNWTSEKSSFPALKRLYLLHCENLNAVPLAFKDVDSLKFMELFYTNKRAALSARAIQDQKPIENGFELSIYPPHH